MGSRATRTDGRIGYTAGMADCHYELGDLPEIDLLAFNKLWEAEAKHWGGQVCAQAVGSIYLRYRPVDHRIILGHAKFRGGEEVLTHKPYWEHHEDGPTLVAKWCNDLGSRIDGPVSKYVAAETLQKTWQLASVPIRECYQLESDQDFDELFSKLELVAAIITGSVRNKST
jgi:hypothetical protein